MDIDVEMTSSYKKNDDNASAPKKFFISKVKKTKNEKLKQIKNPSLKEFTFKFTKRENIDKQLMRKFRKFFKDRIKSKKIILTEIPNIDYDFWMNFSNNQLLPPMVYKNFNESIEFKSFNINYLLWLFSKEGAPLFFNYFVNEYGDELHKSFVDKYVLNNGNESNIQESNTLYIYIKNFTKIFTNDETNSEIKDLILGDTDLLMEEIKSHEMNNPFDFNNFSLANPLSPDDPFKTNEYDQIIGPDIDMNDNGFLFTFK